MAAISQRINNYMRDRLGMDPATVERLRREYYQRYGTTSRGLYLHQGIDLEDYLTFVHDVPLREYLSPDQRLRRVLTRLPGQKVIFTNSPVEHAQRVLRALGVEDCFDHIYDIRFLDYLHKPDPRAYQKALDGLGTGGGDCLLLDDVVRNLLPGKALGMVTVLVSPVPLGGSVGASGQAAKHHSDGVDFVIPRVTELERVMEAP